MNYLKEKKTKKIIAQIHRLYSPCEEGTGNTEIKAERVGAELPQKFVHSCLSWR